MNMDNRNLIIAMALSMAILVFWQWYFVEPQLEAERQQAEMLAEQRSSNGELPSPSASGQNAAMPGTIAADRPADTAARITIDAPSVTGSLSLQGGRFDDLTLLGYRTTQDAEAPDVALFRKQESELPYFAEFGWISSDAGQAAPSGQTIWQSADSLLSPGQPVRLRWNNGSGLLFEREITINEDYLITVTDRVSSNAAAPVVLNPYGLVRRFGTPSTLGIYILHEGPLGVFDETLDEQDYGDLKDAGSEGIKIDPERPGGWIGITDKYWLAALIPTQSETVDYSMRSLGGAGDRYQTDFLGAAVQLAPGGSVSWSANLFAGAKQVALLDKYADELNIANFDLAIDFGWFYFLTKPFFYAITWLNGLLGNFGLAILSFTVLMRLALYPLASKSYRSMGKMRELAPKIQQLREQAGDDRAKMQQEMMALYKREKVNPAAGCLPILLQIPVFFALYKVLYVSIEMRHAPFFGWIQDLSAIDPTSMFNLFGLLPYSTDFLPQFLNVGIWPILMGISMFLQMRMNPPPPDPIQAKIFQYMPIFFTFLLAGFPAGLVIYWTWNNTLSIAQQWWITRSMKKG
ncbi:MAG: membrane protein insertase YidC [Alphaproteobacteria bacterium]|nr:membrane protein insertase YidC [Alphaproteobacteria bacterium]